ncbi:hypothetical protein B0H17DRAFT_1196140 [Mycena rosella]|uniref:Uncharacterized protein n=1 Tax=Mycena rosella TaxID=1033263 RepID=A0AAD7GL66_MYCRO|nr:hypothetical protein B0H17DRAFT_1196140 [Mycena rosella]
MQHPRALLNASHPLCLVARNAADCRPIPAQTNSEFRTWGPHKRVASPSPPHRRPQRRRLSANTCTNKFRPSDLDLLCNILGPSSTRRTPFASSSSPATPLTVGQYLYKQILTFGLGDLSCSILGPSLTRRTPFASSSSPPTLPTVGQYLHKQNPSLGLGYLSWRPLMSIHGDFCLCPPSLCRYKVLGFRRIGYTSSKLPFLPLQPFLAAAASHVVQAEMPARSNFPPRAFLAAWARISDPWPFLTAYRFRMRPAEKMLCTRESDADNMTVVQAQLYWRYCMIQDAMQSEFGRASNCLHAVFGKGFAGAGIY